jgi:hypothetical protein
VIWQGGSKVTDSSWAHFRKDDWEMELTLEGIVTDRDVIAHRKDMQRPLDSEYEERVPKHFYM